MPNKSDANSLDDCYQYLTDNFDYIQSIHFGTGGDHLIVYLTAEGKPHQIPDNIGLRGIRILKKPHVRLDYKIVRETPPCWL